MHSIRIPALNKSDYGVCDVEVAKAARTFYFQVQNKTLSIVKKSQQLQYHEHSPRRAHHHHQEWHPHPPHECLQWTLAVVGCRPGRGARNFDFHDHLSPDSQRLNQCFGGSSCYLGGIFFYYSYTYTVMCHQIVNFLNPLFVVV